MTVLSVKCYMNPQKKKVTHKPRCRLCGKLKTVLRFLSSCIHSFPNKYGRVCRRIAGEYLWRNQNTDLHFTCLLLGGGGDYFKH